MLLSRVFNRVRLSSALILVCGISTSSVYAHQGATGIVKERMDAMKEMGDRMKVMGDMVKGKRAFERQAFIEGAAAVKAHGPKITELFPEGSLGHKTEALPNIWKQWGKFETQANKTVEEGEKLQALLDQNADQKALRQQFVKLGKSCKSCHTDFRKKKKK